MTLYVVRHGKAGSRSAWTEPDDLRPLIKAGRRQAAVIGDALATTPVRQILSSPYVRCRQTVEPLAERLRLPVDLSDALEEGAPLAETLALIDKIGDDIAVLCTHGDVMGELLSHCVRQGVRVETDLLQKGSTWVLETEAGTIVDARYVPPPA
ncbi:MAG: histidine phosphatase family protein [Acidimicrobiia bacterium]|jgi:8-oxo-dGTP diphosphatase